MHAVHFSDYMACADKASVLDVSVTSIRAESKSNCGSWRCGGTQGHDKEGYSTCKIGVYTVLAYLSYAICLLVVMSGRVCRYAKSLAYFLHARSDAAGTRTAHRGSVCCMHARAADR